MDKCIICKQRKGNRFCCALEKYICSLCCGTNRQVEIACTPECNHLKQGSTYQHSRDIDREISSGFLAETDDVFQNPEVVEFVAPIEEFFVNAFYNDKNVNDNDIYNALAQTYSYQIGKIDILNATSYCEDLIFKMCADLDRRFSKIPPEMKAKAILRILKSIKTSSGGVLGNRNYLEMIYSQFNENGKWGQLFY